MHLTCSMYKLAFADEDSGYDVDSDCVPLMGVHIICLLYAN